MNYKELFLNKDKIVMAHNELAVLVGLEEAIVVNKIAYWMEVENNEKHTFDGKVWVYNSYEHWKDGNFPYWSISKIKRLFSKLEKDGIIISATFNKKDWDRTKWYTVNFSKLQDLLDSGVTLNQSNGSKWNDRSGQDETTNTMEYTKNTTKSTFLEGAAVDSTTGKSRSNMDYDESIVEKEVNNSLDSANVKDQKVRIGIINTVLYYYESYRRTFGKEHPRIIQKNMDKVVDRLVCGTDIVEYAGFEQYRQMIDKHFNTVYSDCNYSIMHFVSDGIMNNKFYETNY